MLNERGGYETDCTVTRLGESEFLVVSPTAQATRDADWIRRNIENWNMNDTTTVRDISSSMCVLALMGPRSRDLLSEVMLQKLDNDSFPFGTVKDVSIGHVAARLCRMTYVGELGYEIYVRVVLDRIPQTLLTDIVESNARSNTKYRYPPNQHNSCTKPCTTQVKSSSFEMLDITPSIRCVWRRHIERGDTNSACWRIRSRLVCPSRSIGTRTLWVRNV